MVIITLYVLSQSLLIQLRVTALEEVIKGNLSFVSMLLREACADLVNRDPEVLYYMHLYIHRLQCMYLYVTVKYKIGERSEYVPHRLPQ